ncbi:MAG: hypothetical protein Q4D96_08670 [Propionibacteriaceae bacterium]|nr:hypothetical protein [Propionibacteriaceae bacterium]
MNQLVDLGTLHPGLVRLERPANSTTPGLSRSLGARFTVDPLLVRVFFILLVPVGGVGAVVYVWGVLLTPREGHAGPPIVRALPQFGSWAPRTQWLVIGISSVLAAAAGSRIVPISVIPILLLGLMALLVKRYRPVAPGSPVSAPPSPDGVITEPVEHGPQLPVVDLYAPEPDLQEPAPPRPESSPVSWLGALLVTILGAASYPALELLFGSRLLGAAGALGIAGVVTTGWALLIRSRRLPTIFLLGLLLVAGLFGSLVSLRSAAPQAVADPRHATQLVHAYVADSTVLDLRGLSGADTEAVVVIQAVASQVRVLLDAPPADLQITETVSDVRLVPAAGPAPSAPGLRIRVEATASEVILEHPR